MAEGSEAGLKRYPLTPTLSHGGERESRDEGMSERQCRGAVLVVVLAVILTMMTLGALFLKLMGSEMIMAENLLTRTQAIYIAESGIHVGIVYLQDNTNWPVVLPKAPQILPLAAGSFTYAIDTTALPNRARVVSSGNVGLSERVLEVTVTR